MEVLGETVPVSSNFTLLSQRHEIGQYVSHIEPEKESYQTLIAEGCNEGEECSLRKFQPLDN